MYTTLIIDDEEQARNILADELKAFPEINLIGEADGVEDAIEKIQRLKPDLIFLDIHLGYGNGFNVLNAIDNEDLKVVFVTAYDKYAVQAFKHNALHYILKPIHINDLKDVVRKLQTSSEKLDAIKSKVHLLRMNKIGIQTSDGISFHGIQEIVRCQSDSNYTVIFFANEPKLLSAKTLKDFEDMLTPLGFERVHHSHLVNLHHVRKYQNKDGGHLVMTDGSVIPISQRKKSSFLKVLSEQVQ